MVENCSKMASERAPRTRSAKEPPKWPKNGSGDAPRTPQEAPGRPQDAPKPAPGGPGTPPRRPKTAPRGPRDRPGAAPGASKTAKNGAKMGSESHLPPGPPQEADLGSIWDRFGLDLGPIWGRFLADSGSVLGLILASETSFQVGLAAVLGSICVDVGSIRG